MSQTSILEWVYDTAWLDFQGRYGCTPTPKPTAENHMPRPGQESHSSVVYTRVPFSDEAGEKIVSEDIKLLVAVVAPQEKNTTSLGEGAPSDAKPPCRMSTWYMQDTHPLKTRSGVPVIFESVFQW